MFLINRSIPVYVYTDSKTQYCNLKSVKRVLSRTYLSRTMSKNLWQFHVSHFSVIIFYDRTVDPPNYHCYGSKPKKKRKEKENKGKLFVLDSLIFSSKYCQYYFNTKISFVKVILCSKNTLDLYSPLTDVSVFNVLTNLFFSVLLCTFVYTYKLFLLLMRS